jgi:CDP-6-deoxy-D-xylo-4-hexulose-3-dehydrase
MAGTNDIAYPLASSSWDGEEVAAMHEVIATGMFTMGEHVARFERDFSSYVDAKYCVMANSGSSANLLMVAALFYSKAHKLKRGDEVIVPAVSWPTTYYPLYQYGLKLKFVDIDSETLNIDLKQLEQAVTDQTRMIFAVNLLGNPNDFDQIRTIIGSREILLLEDNCESLGAEFNGQQAGTFGLMGSYSSFFSHHMSTMEGGMVVTDDEELYHILLSLRSHGWTRHLPKHNKVCGIKGDDPFEESFRFVLPGYNLRPLELSGAIGCEQVKKLSGFMRARRENAEKFRELMKAFPQFRIQRETGKSSWFGFSLVIRDGTGITRKQLVRSFARHGVECRPIVAGNFAKNEVVSMFDHSIHGELLAANHIDRNGLFIGNHHYPLDKELIALQAALNDAGEEAA